MAKEEKININGPLKNDGVDQEKPVNEEKPTDVVKEPQKGRADMVNLRVKPAMMIPHVVTFKRKGELEPKDYIFAPDEMVPKELAEALLKNQPHVYEIAKGEPDKKAYKVKDTYEAKQIGELFKDLSQAEKTEVINLIKNIHQRRKKK